MEPSWLGPRFEQTCPECGRLVVVSVDVASVATDPWSERGNEDSPEVRAFRETARSTTCPQCGCDHVPASTAVFKDGDLLRVAPFKSAKRGSERWRAAIFQNEDGVCELKRVVGLPGERATIRNGDLWINGAPSRRSPSQVWSEAAEISPTLETRSERRLALARVVNARRKTSDGSERVESVPTAISNESSIPCFNGGSTTSVELARDFLARFNWDVSGVGDASVAILIRRPEKAWEIEFFPDRGKLSRRSIPLFDGLTAEGKKFEELERADFERGDSLTEIAAPRFANATLCAAASAIDGEIAFSIDGEELLRFETGDAGSLAVAAISTPFVILGDASRASSFKIYRDLHYSSLGGLEETAIPDDEYYVLGDNSPSSRDSRFPDVGTIPASRMLFLVASPEESR